MSYYCKEKLFESQESREGSVYLPNRSSCVIKGIEIVSLRKHDKTMKKLGEVQYISIFIGI